MIPLNLAPLADIIEAEGFRHHPVFAAATPIRLGHSVIDYAAAGGFGAAYQAYTERADAFDPLGVTELPRARVTGDGTVIVARTVVRESIAEYLMQNRDPPAFEGFGDGLRFANRLDRAVDGRTLLLQRPFTQNYGHWLIDCLSWLAALAPRPEIVFDQVQVPMIANPLMTGLVEQTIDLIYPGLPVLARPFWHVWQFDNLLLPDPVNARPPLKHPGPVLALRETVLAAFEGVRPHLPRRVFLDRDGRWVTRSVHNHEALDRLLADRGIVRVFPEFLPFAEQVALFRDAELIVGLKGAAMANIVFAKQARLVALSPTNWPDCFFWDVCTMVGRDYEEVFCTPLDELMPSLRFEVPMARLAEALDRTSALAAL